MWSRRTTFNGSSGPFIEALNAGGLRFVVIGGIAMRLQGASHMTDDIDFAFVRDPQSLEASVKALTHYHPRLHGEPYGVASLEDLWQGATVMDRQGVQVRVASVEALIAMKRAAGRLKYYGHLLELERLRKLNVGDAPSE